MDTGNSNSVSTLPFSLCDWMMCLHICLSMLCTTPVLHTEISKCAGMLKEDNLLRLCSYFEPCWSPFILIVRQSWRVRRNLVVWRWKLASGWFYWISLWAWWGRRPYVSESFSVRFWNEGPEERNCVKKPWVSSRRQMPGDPCGPGSQHIFLTSDLSSGMAPQPSTSLTLVFVK